MSESARDRLEEDERRLQRRGTPGLAATALEFGRHPSPWMIGTSLVVVLVARVLRGDWTLHDAWAPLVFVALFPFIEWIIHVFILHWRPRRVAGLMVDSLLAREHRRHHADPRDIPLVFIPPKALVWVILGNYAVALLAFPSVPMALSFLLVESAALMGYEWTHYLIHSDYKPRGRLYKAVWRNHRLHHYKNEHYWFSVTTAGTSDRVLGTHPDPASVPTSGTAKDLHGAA